MLTHPAVPWYGQIAPRVTPHQQDRDDFSIIFIFNTNVIKPEYFISIINATLTLKLPAEFKEYKDVFNIK
jgi:hypothetical protein